MGDSERTDFDIKAATWDDDPGKVRLANDVSDSILREIVQRTGQVPGSADVMKSMDVLDYGCGSGLVTLRLQPFVKSITGMDSSRKMLEVLQNKVRQRDLGNVCIRQADLENSEKVGEEFHLITSSMTLHHVLDPAALLRQFYGLLLPGGLAAIADLDKEGGSFHHDNKGVLHFGFERSFLKTVMEGAGFVEVRDITAARILRDADGERNREFQVFLIMGKKPG